MVSRTLETSVAHLTSEWWKNLKKSSGKGLPSTGLEAALVKFEKAQAASKKDATLERQKAALAALQTVQPCHQKALTRLGSDPKWQSMISPLKEFEKLLKAELKALGDQVLLTTKVLEAGSREEVVLEELQAVFDKQRAVLTARNSRLGYKTILVVLTKMHQQAEKCKGKLDVPRMQKFTARQQIIDAHLKDMQRRSAEYEDAIAKISKLREQAIAAVGRNEAAITRAKAQVQDLAKKIVEAKKAGNQDALAKNKTAAGLLLKSLVAMEKDVNDQYLASGTVVKDSSDTKAAKMCVEDLTEIVKPFSDKLFQLNRGNKQLMKEIQEIVSKALA